MRRIEELQCLQVHFFKEPRSNYGTMTSIIVHLLRNVSFVVPAKYAHLIEALRDLSYEGVIQRFGMFFLQDLNPVTGELPVIAQMDNAEVALKLTTRVRKVGQSRNPTGARSAQKNTEPTVEYPLGERPTWNELVHCLDKHPARIMHSWRWISLRTWDDYASDLFVAFTKDMWLALDPSRLRNHLGTTNTLQEAVESWSVSHVVENLLSVRFLPNSHGLNKKTKQCWDFADLVDEFKRIQMSYFCPSFHRDLALSSVYSDGNRVATEACHQAMQEFRIFNRLCSNHYPGRSGLQERLGGLE